MCLLVLRYGFTPATDREFLVIRLGHATAGVCFVTTAVLAVVLLARPAPAADPHASTRTVERLAALEQDRQALERERQALRAEVGALGGAVQALRGELGNVGGGVQGVRTRLDRTEGRVAGVEAGLKRLGDDVAQASVRARQVERSVVTRPALAPMREPVVHPAVRPPAPVRRIPEADRVIPAPPAESASPPGAEPVLQSPVSQGPPPAAPAVAAAAPAPPPPPTVTRPNLSDKVRHDWDTIRNRFVRAGDEVVSALRDFSRRVVGRD
jgi:hypothetical protein